MTVRSELALYNPEYCARPHLVALNKADLPDAAQLAQEVAQDVQDAAARMQARGVSHHPRPSLVFLGLKVFGLQLNKADLPGAAQLAAEVARDVQDAAARMQGGCSHWNLALLYTRTVFFTAENNRYM